MTGDPSADVENLRCRTKQQIGLSNANTRVKVPSGSADFTAGSFQKVRR